MVEDLGSGRTLPVYVGAVGAPKVADDPPTALHDDLGVVARDQRIGQDDLIICVPADTHRLESQGKYLAAALLHELTHVHSRISSSLPFR